MDFKLIFLYDMICRTVLKKSRNKWFETTKPD
jgi:hypothetical protein